MNRRAAIDRMTPMLQSQLDALAGCFRDAMTEIGVEAPTSERIPVLLDRPRQHDHGDLACNLALQLARTLKKPPREVAQALLGAFLRFEGGRLVASGETA